MTGKWLPLNLENHEEERQRPSKGNVNISTAFQLGTLLSLCFTILFPHNFFYSYLFYYSCPNFPPLPSSTLPTPNSHSPSPYHSPCPWVTHVCSLTSPFTFFQSDPTPPLPTYSCQSTPCFHASGFVLLISLFCSSDSFYK